MDEVEHGVHLSTFLWIPGAPDLPLGVAHETLFALYLRVRPVSLDSFTYHTYGGTGGGAQCLVQTYLDNMQTGETGNQH